MNHKENIIIGGLGAVVSNIASINGMDIIQSLLIAFLGGFFSVVGKDFYKKIKENK